MPTRQGWRYRLGVFLRGAAMGAADVVPGVSGGTVAFITGIYEELLASIRAVDLRALRLLLAGEFRRCWQHVNGSFLLALALGILLSVLTLASLISHALEVHPIPLMAFFFGLILASTFYIAGEIEAWTLSRAVLFALAAVLAIGIGLLRPASLPPEPLWIFLSGSVAICAMILPGVSGSFILLLLGMYAPIIAAVSEFKLSVMLIFAAGCAVGLMLFARLLHWLLRRYHAAILAFLTGILAGSLTIVWPWKLPISVATDPAGGQGAAGNVWPWQYAQAASADTLAATLSALVGLLLVLALSRVTAARPEQPPPL